MIVVGRADDARFTTHCRASRHSSKRTTCPRRHERYPHLGVGEDRPGARHRRAVHAHRRGDRRGARQPGACRSSPRGSATKCGRSRARTASIPTRAPNRPSGGQSSGLIAHKPSMLQDYERGRPMEIEAQLVVDARLRARGKCRSAGAGNRRAADRVQGGRQGAVRGLESPRDEAESCNEPRRVRAARAPAGADVRQGARRPLPRREQGLGGAVRHAARELRRQAGARPVSAEPGDRRAARGARPRAVGAAGRAELPDADRHAGWPPPRHDLLQGDLSR